MSLCRIILGFVMVVSGSVNAQEARTSHDAAVDAAKAGDIAALESFVSANAIDALYGIDHKTLLMVAAENGRPDAVRFLLRQGADPNAGTQSGSTAAHLAAYSDQAETLTILLTNGGDVFATNQSHWDVVDAAMFVGARNAMRAIVKCHADRRAGISGSIKTHTRNTERIANDPTYGSLLLMWLALDGDIAATRAILDAGAAADSENMLGHTALHVAARFGEAPIVEFLLSKGVDPDSKTASRYTTTPLMEASRDSRTDIARLLVDADASVNVPDFHNDNVLNWATYFGHEEFVVYLLSQGADHSMRGQTDDNALDIALREKHAGIVKHLREAGAAPSK